METTQNTPTTTAAVLRRQSGFIILFALLLALAAAIAVLFAYESRQQEHIYAGVSAAGVDLSGLTPSEAVIKLQEALVYPNGGQIVFSDGEQRWQFTPAELGFSYDIPATVTQAFQIGRQSGLLGSLMEQLGAYRKGRDVTPAIVYDQSKAYSALQQIARQVDTPMREAEISISGAQVSVQPGQVGRQVDLSATLSRLDAYLITQQYGTIALVVSESEPLIMDAGPTAETARAILSAPFTILPPEDQSDAGPWQIAPEALAKLLRVERQTVQGSEAYVLSLDQQALVNYLGTIAPSLRREPMNARMMFNDETRQLELLQKAVPGGSLDVEKSAIQILDAVQAGGHEARLVMDEVNPPVTDTTTAAELGITELVSEYTSYFWGSAAERVQNIHAAASSFHGVLVAPGEVFSMARYLTDISLENGYAEAVIIVGDQSVKGVGGGVCQVSTTLFRAAFFGGFPIVERYAHAYRVSYYEQMSNGVPDTDLAGLDATVYVPLVDFKFKNDTPYWLLMETYPTDHSLTWKFYSTSDGRSMEWDTTGLTNITPPPEPIYREDPTLPAGEIRQVDWAVAGASVEVYRTVYRDGAVYFTDTIRTTYVPWPDGFNYGPGTDLTGLTH
jgi:vancomycin resistance protein YoaR